MADKSHPSNSELSTFADGKLDPTLSRQIEDHVARCERCSETVRTRSWNSGSSENQTDALDTQDYELSTDKDSACCIRCPTCHTAMFLDSDVHYHDVTCESCGTSFDLVDREVATSEAPPLKQVGHFELVSRLGYGSFGVVWKAHDRKLNRTVAVKIPRKGKLDANQTEQFLREARAAAQLNHPNIISIHEAGQIDRTVYIVSEFIRGVRLSDWLTAKSPSYEQAVELCIQIAEALEHAHASGIIHRDLKPSNIMLDDADVAYVMDFGLAKRDHGELTMTIDGQVLGTPAYMSPEQARGDAKSADRRADIYSLGVILFELMTGQRPFRGNAAMLIHQVQNDDAPSPRQLEPKIPRDLETICLKCLERDRRQRYDTAAEVVAELKRFLAHEPIRARSIGRLDRTWRWCRRHRTVSISILALVLVILTGMSLELGQWRKTMVAQNRELETRRSADHALKKAKQDQQQASQRLSELHDRTSDMLLRKAETLPADKNREALTILKEAATYDRQYRSSLIDQANGDRAADSGDSTYSNRQKQIFSQAVSRLTTNQISMTDSVEFDLQTDNVGIRQGIFGVSSDGQRIGVLNTRFEPNAGFMARIRILTRNGQVVYRNAFPIQLQRYSRQTSAPSGAFSPNLSTFAVVLGKQLSVVSNGRQIHHELDDENYRISHFIDDHQIIGYARYARTPIVWNVENETIVQSKRKESDGTSPENSRTDSMIGKGFAVRLTSGGIQVFDQSESKPLQSFQVRANLSNTSLSTEPMGIYVVSAGDSFDSKKAKIAFCDVASGGVVSVELSDSMLADGAREFRMSGTTTRIKPFRGGCLLLSMSRASCRASFFTVVNSPIVSQRPVTATDHVLTEEGGVITLKNGGVECRKDSKVIWNATHTKIVDFGFHNNKFYVKRAHNGKGQFFDKHNGKRIATQSEKKQFTVLRRSTKSMVTLRAKTTDAASPKIVEIRTLDGEHKTTLLEVPNQTTAQMIMARYSPNANYLLIGMANMSTLKQSMTVWGLAKRVELCNFELEVGDDFQWLGERFINVLTPERVRLFELSEGRLVCDSLVDANLGPNRILRSISHWFDDRYLYSISTGANGFEKGQPIFSKFDLSSGKAHHKKFARSAERVEFSRDGRFIVLQNPYWREIEFWDTSNLELVARIRGKRKTAGSESLDEYLQYLFTSDCTHAIVAFGEFWFFSNQTPGMIQSNGISRFEIWNLEKRTKVPVSRDLSDLQERGVDCRLVVRGNRLHVSRAGERDRVINIRDGKMSQGDVVSRFSRQRDWAIASSADGLRLYVQGDEVLLAKTKGFSPSDFRQQRLSKNRKVLFLSSDRIAGFWHAQTGHLLYELPVELRIETLDVKANWGLMRRKEEYLLADIIKRRLSEPVQLPKQIVKNLSDLKVSNGGRELAFRQGKKVQLWNSEKMAKEFLPENHVASRIFYDSANRQITSMSQSGEALVRSVDDGQIVRAYETEPQTKSVWYIPDGIGRLDYDGEVLRLRTNDEETHWSIDLFEPLRNWTRIRNEQPIRRPVVNDFAFSSDLRWAFGLTENRVLVIGLKQGTIHGVLDASDRQVKNSAIATCVNSSLLAVGKEDGSIEIWSGESHRILQKFQHTIEKLLFTSSTVLVVFSGGQAHWLDVATGRKLLSMEVAKDRKIINAQSTIGGSLMVLNAESNSGRGSRSSDAMRLTNASLNQLPMELKHSGIDVDPELVTIFGDSDQLSEENKQRATDKWSELAKHSQVARNREVAALLEKARALQSKGRLDDALETFSLALFLDPANGEGWWQRGKALAHSNNSRYIFYSIADMDKALQYLDDDTIRVERTLAKARTGKPDDTIEELEKISPDKLSARGYLYRGIARLRSDKWSEAKRDLTRALEAESDLSSAYLWRALAHLGLDSPEESKSDYLKAAELNDQLPLGELNALNSVYARKVIQLVAKKQHSNASALFEQMHSLAQKTKTYSQEIRDAEVEYQNADPVGAMVANQLAWILVTTPDRTLRDAERAVKLALEAAREDPKQAAYLNTLGVAQFRTGDYDAARNSLGESLRLTRRGYESRAQIFRDSTEWQDVFAPHDTLFLCMLDHLQGETEKAKRTYNSVARYISQTPIHSNEELLRFQAEAAILLFSTDQRQKPQD